jgi:hypothetical protein
MNRAEKIQHNLDVLKRLEKCHTDVISITNANNPFASLIGNNSTDILEVILLYRNFDKLRNGLKERDEEKTQHDFESYLEHTEDTIIKVRDSAKTLAETGLRFSSIEESHNSEFGEMIKKQVIKFKNWLTSKVNHLSELKEIIKNDLSYIEKEIQKEFSKIR